MADTSRNDSAKETESQQAAKGDKALINPFKDTAGSEAPQPTVEEETDLEQQRKEAMTERD